MEETQASGTFDNDDHFGVDPEIIFEIEGVIFGIPRSQLLQSEFFRDMLESKHIGGKDEGSMDNPIVLEKISQVTLSQAKALHKVMNCRRFEPAPNLSVQQWSGALQLAALWGFDNLKEFIIPHLDSQVQDPLRRIEIADTCGIKEWLHPAYAKLCAKESPLTAEEGQILGIRIFAALCRVREEEMKDDKPFIMEQPPSRQGQGGFRGRGWGGRGSGWRGRGGWEPPPHFLSVPHEEESDEYAQRSGDTACRKACCKVPFELNSREKSFLLRIGQAKDL